MRATLAHVISSICVVTGAVGAPPCTAQTRVASLEELRGTLAPGDSITIVPADGQPLAGRLIRLGQDALDLRVVDTRRRQGRGSRDVTMPLAAIRFLERRRDPVKNGAAIGAGIGAGFGAAMFAHALVIDRNELEEWAPLYVGATAACTGIGALIGWGIDAARSKPHITFDPFHRQASVSVQPVLRRARGIAVAVSF